LSFQLPSIRRKLLEAIDCSRENEVAYLILKFYDEYMSEVRKHMQHENRKIFTYVNGLMEGVKTQDFEIAQFAKGHDAIDRKLQELKNIIIKYYTRTDGYEMLAGVLFDIFNCEADLRAHCAVEDALFVPAVQRLEKEVAENGRTIDEELEEENNSANETLSDREKEIVGCIVKGMTNKEIAQTLFISVNTVLTHRKNISRKLNIHSISGLTIYAIVNKIVKLDEVHLK
jgi:regulator of cell morphogenesis and NO signaling